MANNLPVISDATRAALVSSGRQIQFVLLTIAGNKYGVAVSQVNDIVQFKHIFNVPKAPVEVNGVVNLRGRIVTVIDLPRMISGNDIATVRENYLAMSVEYRNDLYAMLVDSVGEVITMPVAEVRKVPENLTTKVYNFSSGVVELENDLVTLINAHLFIDYILQRRGTLNTVTGGVGIDINLFENPL